MREGVFSEDELAVRTKRVYQAIVDALTGKRDAAETLTKAEIALSYVKLKAAEGGKTQYLLFLGRREISALAKIIDEYWDQRSEEHTSELQSLMRISYAVFCLKKKTNK